MQRRHPIAWDCTTDEVREKFYNGMAEELDWTWKEIERLRVALKPFAAYADKNRIAPANLPISIGSPIAKVQLTMGDCYAAADILYEQQTADDPRMLEERGWPKDCY